MDFFYTWLPFYVLTWFLGLDFRNITLLFQVKFNDGLDSGDNNSCYEIKDPRFDEALPDGSFPVIKISIMKCRLMAIYEMLIIIGVIGLIVIGFIFAQWWQALLAWILSGSLITTFGKSKIRIHSIAYYLKYLAATAFMGMAYCFLII